MLPPWVGANVIGPGNSEQGKQSLSPEEVNDRFKHRDASRGKTGLVHDPGTSRADPEKANAHF